MKFKIFLGVAAGMMAIAPLVVLGAYNDVNLSSGTTIRTTVGGSEVSLTVTSGVIQSITVSETVLDIALAAGSSIDITSAEKRSFTYSVNKTVASFECGSSSSVLSLSLPPSQTTETVGVTPLGTTCVAVGAGGSGSSGSSSSSTSSTETTTTSTTSSSATPTSTTTTTTSTSATPSTTSTTATAASAPTTTITVAPVAVSVPSVAVLSTELNPGVRNDEVTTLQTLLAKDPAIYPEGTVSGFYGPKTTAAVKKFQAKYGLPTVGRVGPATMAKINEVLGSTTAVSPTTQTQTTQQQIESQINAIQSQINALTSGATVTGAITTELDPGARSSEVTTLQTLLAKDPAIYPEGTVSGFYGPKTTAAVKKFQAKYGLPTVGRVGPATLEKINEVLGGAVTPESPSSVAPQSTESTATASMIDQITAQIKAIQDQIKALQGQ